MRDETLLYWGMVVTTFLIIAGVLTAHELIQQYFENRGETDEEEANGGDVHSAPPR